MKTRMIKTKADIMFRYMTMYKHTEFAPNVFEKIPYVVFLGGYPRWQDHLGPPSPGVGLSTSPSISPHSTRGLHPPQEFLLPLYNPQLLTQFLNQINYTNTNSLLSSYLFDPK